jgi:hypothetical protein
VGFDPPAVLPHRVVGGYIGLTLFYPALAALGLVEIARQSFALPRSQRFGVRAVTLTLLFLTLLGKVDFRSSCREWRVARRVAGRPVISR